MHERATLFFYKMSLINTVGVNVAVPVTIEEFESSGGVYPDYALKEIARLEKLIAEKEENNANSNPS